MTRYRYMADGTVVVLGEPVASTPTEGWRLWYTKPAETSLSLYSPIYQLGREGVPRSMCRIDKPVMHAGCPVNRLHVPPEPGCRCGIYAVSNVVDALYRMGAMTENIRRRDGYNSWFPFGPSNGMVPVLAHVALTGAVTHDDVGTWCPLADVREQIGVHTPVLRAASVGINRMFVTPNLVDDDADADVLALARRLALSFRTETTAGFPPVSRRDWDGRPTWMRTEPWRSKYRVDAVLPCREPVRPLHIVFVCWGNICRSPMAEKIFAHQIAQRGLSDVVRVSSAGTHGHQHAGGPADPGTVLVLRDRGYPSAHRAAQISRDQLDADLVVALDRTNAQLLANAGVPAERIRLLRSFDPNASALDVANPYLGSAEKFERCHDAIATALPGLHKWVDDRV